MGILRRSIFTIQQEPDQNRKFSIEVYYCNKPASIQQAYAAEFISRKFDVIVVSSQDSKALKNIVEYTKILQSKVVTFIRRIENIKVDAYIASNNKEVGRL